MIMAPGKDTPIATTRMTGPDTDDYDESEEIANARLIAAAPDMEKALEMYIQAEDSELPSVEHRDLLFEGYRQVNRFDRPADDDGPGYDLI